MKNSLLNQNLGTWGKMFKTLLKHLRKMWWYHLGAWEGDLDPETGKLRKRDV